MTDQPARPQTVAGAPSGQTADAAPRNWVQDLAPYRGADPARSLFEVVITAVPFFGFWILALALVGGGQWWGLVFTLPASLFLVRLFMIQHDCGHGSLFRSRETGDWLGRAIGVLTFTPYDYWRRLHAQHHASAGNLDRRGVGDVRTLTVEEYRSLSARGRLAYRVFRSSAFLLLAAPVLLFVVNNRFPAKLFGSGRASWISVWGTNIAIVAVAIALSLIFGFVAWLAVQVVISLISGAIGVWLFFVQHQFEGTYWAHDDDWAFETGALHGSSHYDLPEPIRWFTANIGIHHVHHLASRIPFYRLPKVLRDFPELREPRMTLRKSLGAARLALWDERLQRLVSFREAAQSA